MENRFMTKQSFDNAAATALTVATSRGPVTLALGPKTTIAEAFRAM
jgi:hypothetical protein